MSEIMHRSTTEIPVRYTTQVLVIGGGPAGFSAAVTAARQGAEVMIVERGNSLGGMWTMGLLSPYFENQNGTGLNQELREGLMACNGWGGLRNISFDHCKMVMLLDEIAEKAGVKILFHVMAQEPIMEGNKIKGVIIATKEGLCAIKADIVIDCSGDGDIAAAAGAEYKMGREADGLMQPMTMMFKVTGINPEYSRDDIIGWYKELVSRINEDELLKKIPYNYPAIIKLPNEGEALFQWTHVKYLCGANIDDVTHATLEGRKQVKYALEALKNIKDVVGDVRLIDLPAVIGVRDTRRIVGDYYITDEDVKSGKRFDDSIVKVHFGIDIHEPDKGKQTCIRHNGFYVPFRSLLPKGFDNLMVAGRCISGCWNAHAAYRVTGICVVMGEAAGAAAALSLKQNKSVREIDFADLNITEPC